MIHYQRIRSTKCIITEVDIYRTAIGAALNKEG